MTALPPRKPTAALSRKETPTGPHRLDKVAWRTENAEAIAYQNRLVEEEGAFGDDLRSF